MYTSSHASDKKVPKMDVVVEYPDKLEQAFDSSGIYSDSDLDPHSPARTSRTTYRDKNGRIRSLITQTSSAERRRNFLFTQSCNVESVNAYLKSLPDRPSIRRTRSRECYDIRVQMGNKTSVKDNQSQSIDSAHSGQRPDEELEVVSVTTMPANSTLVDLPNRFRPMSPPVMETVPNQSRQIQRSAAPFPGNPSSRMVRTPQNGNGGAFSPLGVPLQIPQREDSLAPLPGNHGNCGYGPTYKGGYRSGRGYASSMIGPSNPSRRAPSSASSQIGPAYRPKLNIENAQSHGASAYPGRSPPSDQDDSDTFVVMPNLNKPSQKKRTSSVIVPVSPIYDDNIPAGHIRTDTMASSGASSGSFATNLKSVHDICYDICNTFWRPYLTFNPYKHGDEVVEFGSLWPEQSILKNLLVEAYQTTSLRRSVLDICKLVIRCGPVRVLQTLVTSRIISIDQVFENGCSMLHLACLARNNEAVSYLISANISQKILDKYGRKASQLCYDPALRRQLAPQFRSGNPCPPIKPASMLDKETIFHLAKCCKEYDELQIKLQSLDFDVNQEMNQRGDYLIHVVTREGLPQLAQLLSLVKIEGACIDQYNLEGKTPLMIAAELDYVVMVDVMLCILGANLNAPNPNTGECALHYAAKNNNVNVVNCLITRGADFNLEDSDGNRPDDSAAHFNAVDSEDVIISHRVQRIQSLSSITETGNLTSSQIKVTDLYQTNKEGDTLIMTAAKNNRVDNLLILIEREGCHVDAQHEKSGRTALAMAAILGHESAAEELLKYDANPAIGDVNHDLPLHHSLVKNHLGTASLLLQYPNALTGLSKALRLCPTDGAHSMIRQAVQRRQAELVNPELFECALRGDAGRLYCLLEEGDFVNPTSGVGDWPLYLAAENGHLDVVVLLHQYGGDVSRRHPSTRNTVLHAACLRGHMSIVRYLIENCRKSSRNQRPLDVNAVNGEMKTALQTAAEKGYSRMVRLLLNNGAASAFLDPSGSLFCCRDFQGVQVLLENRRDAHSRDVMALVRDSKKLAELKSIFYPKFDHNLRDKTGDTPLMVACRYACLEVVNFLLESAIHNLAESEQDCAGDGESDTDSGTVMDLVNTVSSARISKQPSQDLVSVIERQRRASQGTVGLSETDPDPISTYTDFAESGDFDTSSAYPVPGSDARRSRERRDVHVNVVQNPRMPSHQRAQSRDFDADTVIDLPTTHPMEASGSHLLGCNPRLANNMFMTANVISHVCAVNPRDGRTALHRALETGDHVGILLALIKTDAQCANIQDFDGMSPLHLACKSMRKKCVERLTTLPNVDLNSRTLDGQLPEEMTKNRHIINAIIKARELQPCQPISSQVTIDGSIAGQSFGTDGASTIDFDLLAERFQEMQAQKGK